MIEAQKAMEERMIADLPLLAPIGLLVVAAVGGVALCLALGPRHQVLVAWFVAALHVAAAIAACLVWTIAGFQATMENTLMIDGPFLFACGIVGVAGAVAVAMLRSQVAGTDREGELYAVLSAASLGSVVMAGTNDAAMLALALGLTGIASYILVGYLRGAHRSTEAALKFYIYGTVAGATMVYGLTWWYGLAGTTEFTGIGEELVGAPDIPVLGATAFFIAGLGFKVSAVPFHFWAPDAYEGAPTSVAVFISVVPKVGALVALERVLTTALPGSHLDWPLIIGLIAAASMALGVLLMIPQQNAIRLLAYSSISQSGFLLIAVSAGATTDLGTSSLLYYLAAYAAANLAAFAVVIAVERETGSVAVDALRGLGRRHPWWTVGLIVSLLSLLGLPPLAGFVGKLEVFTAAIDAEMTWLAVIGIVATVVSLYPYLRLFGPAVLDRPPDRIEQIAASPQPISASSLRWATVVSVVATIAFGVVAQPLLSASNTASRIEVSASPLHRTFDSRA